MSPSLSSSLCLSFSVSHSQSWRVLSHPLRFVPRWFQRPGAWCPSTTPGFTKADARIAFGQSAPDLHPWYFHTHTHLGGQVDGLICWMEISGCNIASIHLCQRANGAIQSKYPFLHLLKLSFIILFDPQFASGQHVRMDKKERMVRLEQRTEREGKEKGWREKREGESSNSCLSSV